MHNIGYKTGNPALTASVFREAMGRAGEEKMTLMGTVHKTALALLIVLMAGSTTWGMTPDDALFGAAIWGGMLGGLIVAMVIIFKKHLAPMLTPVYAVLEGFFLGAISGMFDLQYEGIVSQAVIATLGVLATMLMAYQSKLIRPTENFKLGIISATGGIFLLYLTSMILGFFGVDMAFMHDSSPLSIGISVFIVCIAALNLVLDFDFIETGAEMGAPKYMEWFGAFGLLVTLIWLYIEILRLLAKMRER